MAREIIFDTETTGMDPAEGDRLVEIGCVELVNHIPTGRTYHQYINPERDVPADAVAVHGLTSEFLKDKPVFSAIFADFLEFVGEDGILVAHNASFDMKFINAELKKVGHSGIADKRVADSLAIARKKFPGSPASLDALCRRFNISLEDRTLHGALLDAELLAEVWLELNGGRQHGFSLSDSGKNEDNDDQTVSKLASQKREFKEPRPHAASADELKKHQEMLSEIKDALWVQQKSA